MAVNVGVIAAGAVALFIASKFIGGDRPAVAGLTAPDELASRLEDPFFFASLGSQAAGIQPAITPEPDEGSFFFDGGLDFGALDGFEELAPGPSLGDLLPSGESLETPEQIAETDRAAANLDSQLAAEAARVAAAEAADLPRVRQFYIDDLVDRLGVPLAFFGTVPGNDSVEIVSNYNGIYETYLAQLNVTSGQEAAVTQLVALQAQLTQELQSAGVQGTPTGNTENELRASAQALVDQHAAALIQQQQSATAAAAIEVERLAADQAAAAAASEVQRQSLARQEALAQEAAFTTEESGFFFQTDPLTVEIVPEATIANTLINPVFEPDLAQRREESGIDFFGTFAFDPDIF